MQNRKRFNLLEHAPGRSLPTCRVTKYGPHRDGNGGAKPSSWLNQAIHVKNKEAWVFIKVHTHGALERNADVLLGSDMERFLGELGGFFAENDRFDLHYVTAREMVNIIRAAEAEEGGSPGDYRDFELITSY